MDEPESNTERIANVVGLAAEMMVRTPFRPDGVSLSEWLCRFFEELDPATWADVVLDPKRRAEGWCRVLPAIAEARSTLMAAVEVDGSERPLR